MRTNEVRFSVAAHAAWAPGIDTEQAWEEWADAPRTIAGESEPALRQMPPMLRRRAGFLGKMALEVAYRCLDGRAGVPTVFCSRHGEVTRALGLLTDLVQGSALSPTGFGLAVHNASAGLFSIARADRANHLALAAGASSVEHAVIEACGLLADGAAEVLLVVYDDRLPDIFAPFRDCTEQPHAWAWLMTAPEKNVVHLSWRASPDAKSDPEALPAGLEVLRFHVRADRALERFEDGRCWRWTRDA
jgi:hypothetical protein